MWKMYNTLQVFVLVPDSPPIGVPGVIKSLLTEATHCRSTMYLNDPPNTTKLERRSSVKEVLS